MSPYLIIVLYSCVTHVTSQCQGTCYSVSFPKNKNVKGKHLRGHSYKNITTATDVPQTCFSSCINDCRCKAFQMKDVRCELLDEDKTSKAADFVSQTGYAYYDLHQTFYKGKSHPVQPAGVCYNGCCRTQSCMNGGTCVEHSKDPNEKFTRKCPNTHCGKICGKKISSCIDVFKGAASGTIPANGTYIITRSDTKTTVPVYCAFDSPNQAWSLFESFSLVSNVIFKTKAFHQNYPRKQLSPNWDDYCLSLSNMQYIKKKTTMFRATCDFPNRDHLTPDFLLGYRKDLDIIFGNDLKEQCVEFSYLNLRGYEFRSTKAPVWHNVDNEHLNMDYSWEYYGFRALKQYRTRIDVFGFYSLTTPNSKCTATQQSTTQWWLGEQQ